MPGLPYFEHALGRSIRRTFLFHTPGGAHCRICVLSSHHGLVVNASGTELTPLETPITIGIFYRPGGQSVRFTIPLTPAVL